jgi:hypothetical protein
VLLDNVANGWTYNTITWADVVGRDLAAAGTVRIQHMSDCNAQEHSTS